jgi:hypothetical protein
MGHPAGREIPMQCNLNLSEGDRPKMDEYCLAMLPVLTQVDMPNLTRRQVDL